MFHGYALSMSGRLEEGRIEFERCRRYLEEDGNLELEVYLGMFAAL